MTAGFIVPDFEACSNKTGGHRLPLLKTAAPTAFYPNNLISPASFSPIGFALFVSDL
jgi:hypothetical protein